MITKFRILAIIAIFITGIGFSANNQKLSVDPIGKNKILLSYESETDTPFEITIRDEGGETLYHWQSKIPLERFKKVFNLTELEKGEYSLCIDYGENCINHALEINEEGIAIDTVFQLYKPYFSYENQMLKLSFLNPAQNEVFLYLYTKNELVNQINLGKDLNVQRIFNLSKLYDGEYDVVLTDFFKEYHFEVLK